MRYFLHLFFLSFVFLSFGQRQDKVDFLHADVFIEPIPEKKEVKGLVSYEFKVLQDVDSVFLDAKNMDFSSVRLNKKRINFSNNNKTITIKSKFKAGKEYLLKLTYLCVPKQTVYFLGWNDDIKGNEQVWTQGQGKYTSHWLPSFDDMVEKVEFDLNISSQFDGMQRVANGVLTEGKSNHNGGSIISFDMQKSMSSYLLAFAIGNYDKQELTSKSGIPIENYYYPQDSSRVEPTYRYTKKIFDFLEEEIGVPYPWQNYKQIPVRDFLYAGMENTSATIFSDGYVIDSTAFVDKNYVNVNAHELAHQWFGNLVTEKDGNHHWLHEGFATYYAYLAEKEIFGDDHFYWKFYNSWQQLQAAVDSGEGQSLLDPKASSLTFYEKGAWALIMLRNEIGEVAFKTGMAAYLNTYAFKNATVADFLKEMETSSGKDLAPFRAAWLKNTGFPFEDAKKELAEKSSSLKLLFDLEAELQAAQRDDIDYVKYWDATNSIHLKTHLLKYYNTSLPEEIYARAFESDTIPVRQALFSGQDLPKFLNKERLESLLEDESYMTQESALFTLWQAYPEDRANHLEKLKNVSGLPNKNIRLLWLTLAILTNDFEGNNTQQYFTELSGYTSPEYTWETRMGAFQYVSEIGFSDQGLKNLINATVHHSWQFRKYARNLMDELLKDPDYKMRIEALSKELKEEELRYTNTKLSKK